MLRRRTLAAGLGLLGVALATGVGVVTSEWGSPLVTSWVSGVVSDALAPGWHLSVDRLRLRLTGGVELDGFVLRDPQGQPGVVVPSLRTDLALTNLLWGEVMLESLVIERPTVGTGFAPDGVFNLASAFGVTAQAPEDEDVGPWRGLSIDLRIHDLRLNRGTYWLEDDQGRLVDVADLIAAADQIHLPRGVPEVTVAGARLSGVLQQPGAVDVEVAGDVVYRLDELLFERTTVAVHDTTLGLEGSLGLGDNPGSVLLVDVPRLDLSVVNAFAASGLAGTYTGQLKVEGGLQDLGVSGRLEGTGETRGALELEQGSAIRVLPEAGGPMTWNATLRPDGVHLEDLLPVVGGPLVLEGTLAASGELGAWPTGTALSASWVADDIDLYGVRLRHAELDEVILKDGVLVFPRVKAVAVAGELEGSASLNLMDGNLEGSFSGPLQLDMLNDVGLTDVSGGGTLTLGVEGALYDPGAPIDIRGRIRARDVALYGLAADRLSGPYSVRVDAGVVSGSLDLGLDRFRGYGVHAPTARIWPLTFTVDAEDGVSVEAELGSPDMSYPSIFRVTDVRAPLSVHVPFDESLMRVDVDADLGGHDLFGLPGDAGHLAMTMEGDELRADLTLRSFVGDWLQMEGFRLDVPSRWMTVQQVRIQPSHRQRWASRGPWKLQLLDNGIKDAELSLLGRLGEISVLGTFDFSGDMMGDVEVRDFHLDALAELFPWEWGGAYGMLDATLMTAGSVEEPLMTLDVEGTDLFVPFQGGLLGEASEAGSAVSNEPSRCESQADPHDGEPTVTGLRWMDVSGTVSLDASMVEAHADIGVDGVKMAHADLMLPVRGGLFDMAPRPDGALDMNVVLEPLSFTSVELLADGLDLPEGRLSGAVHVRGEVLDPQFDLQATVMSQIDGLNEQGRVELELTRVGRRLTAGVEVFEGFRPLATVDGTGRTRLSEIMTWAVLGGEPVALDDLSTYVDDVDLLLALDAFPFGTALSLAGLPTESAAGHLGGYLDLSGAVLSPDIVADLKLNGTVGDLETQGVVSVRHEPEVDGHVLTSRFGPARTPWLTANGHLPLQIDLSREISDWGAGEWEIELDGDGIPMALAQLLDAGVRDAEGRLTVSGHLGGELFKPSPAIQAGLSGGRLAYDPLGVQVDDLSLASRLRSGQDRYGCELMLVDIQQLQGRTHPLVSLASVRGESRVAAHGKVAYGRGGLAIPGLDVALNRAWLTNTDDLQVRASGDVAISAEAWPFLQMSSSNLAIDTGYIALDTAELLASSRRQLDERLKIHRSRQGRAMVLREPEEEGLLDALQAEMTVDLGLATRLDISVPILEDLGVIGAQLTQADVSARLRGESLGVRYDGGQIDVAGNVGLIEGEVSILNSTFRLDSDSNLGFTGRTVYDPNLDIKGSMVTGGTQLDLLLSGTAEIPELELSSPSDLSEDQMLTVLLTGQAPEELTGQQGALDALGGLVLDSVLGGVNLGAVSVDADGTVVVGIPVRRNIFVESTVTPRPDIDENIITVEGEWTLLPSLVLSAAYGDKLTWAQLFWEWRF